MGQLPLRVLDAGGNIITENVFVASVTIWNSGTAEVKTSDIRDPFHVKVGDASKPLDFTVTYWSHKNVDEFQVAQNGHMSWAHFDPGEGIKLRIVYINDSMQKISLEGIAVGIGTILDQTQAEKNQRDQNSSPFVFVVAVLAMLVPGIIGIVILRQWATNRDRIALVFGSLFLSTTAGTLILITVIFWKASTYPNPPF